MSLVNADGADEKPVLYSTLTTLSIAAGKVLQAAALAVLGVGWPKVDAMIVQKRSSKTGKIITKYRNDGDAFMPGETILACPPEHGRIWNNAGKSFTVDHVDTAFSISTDYEALHAIIKESPLLKELLHLDTHVRAASPPSPSAPPPPRRCRASPPP